MSEPGQSKKTGRIILWCVAALLAAVLAAIFVKITFFFKGDTIPDSGDVTAVQTEDPEPSETALSPIEEQKRARDELDQIGGVVYYSTTEEPYCDGWYGTDSLRDFSCGPSTMSMVISTLSDDIVIDPIAMCDWSVEHGYWCPGGGTYTVFLTAAAEQFGIPVRQDVWTKENIYSYLDRGKLIIFTVGPGAFTNGSHFLLLRGYTEEGNLLICDSYSRKFSMREWSYDELYGQLINNMIWIYG